MHAARVTRTWLAEVLAAGGALVMFLALVPGVASAQENHRGVPNVVCDEDTPQAAFSDRASADDVHLRGIDCVAAMDIAEGSEGAYWPNVGVTRGQMASFIARTLEAANYQLPESSDQGFEDIAGTEHEARINQLAEIGVVEGRSAERYEPRLLVNRAQMASYIVRAVSWADATEYGAVAGNHFPDTEGNVHTANVSAGYELWLFEGVAPGAYQPGDTVERDQMATFLTRALDFIHPNRDTGSNLTYLVAPQEAMEATIGQPVAYEIVQRYDNKPLTGPVDIALFPCSLVDGTDLPLTMSDLDTDELADGIATSNTGAAHFSGVNGIPTVDRPAYVNDAEPDAEGRIEFTLAAASSDCTVAVAFGDRAPADELRLDAANRPVSPHGHGVVSWAPADDDGGPDVIGETGTATVASDDFPSLGGDTALLRDVRTGTHDGFDRVVLEFEGDDPPSYQIGYIDPPVLEDGSGNEVHVEGSAFLEVRATPAAGYDPLNDAEETYLGPDRFAPAGIVAVQELVEIGDFESNLGWVLGLDHEAEFAVEILQDPLRIVVDVVHADA